MSAQSDPRRSEAFDADPRYYYRRSLSARELLPAIGVGLAAGLATFYVASLFIERTPLRARVHDIEGPSEGQRRRPLLELRRQGRSSARSVDKNLGRR